MRLVLESIDILSTESRLYTFGKERYTTKFGVVMSIICISAVLAMSTYFIIGYFNKEESNVILSHTSNFYPYVNLTEFPLLFSFWNQNTNKKVDPTVASMVVTYWEMKGEITEMKQLELEPCDINKHFGNYSYLYKDLNLTNFECLPAGKYNISLYGRAVEKKKGYFNFYFSKCTNNSIYHNNRTNCKDPGEIDINLTSANHFLTYILPAYIVNHSERIPVRLESVSEQLVISTSFYFQHYVTLKHGLYYSNDGFIFNDVKNYTYFDVDFYAYKLLIFPSKAVKVPNSFSSLQMTFSETSSDVFNRRYVKFQSVLANIGGVLKFLISIGSVIVKYFTSFDYIIEHSERILSLKKKKETEFNYENMIMSFKSKDLEIKRNEPNMMEHENSNPAQKSSSSTSRKIFTVQPIFDAWKNRPRHKYEPPEKLMFNLSCKEILCPLFCLKKNSKRHLWERVRKLIRQVLSTDYLLGLINDFYKLKKVVLDENQNLIFDSARNHDLEEKEAIILEKYNFYLEMKNLNADKKTKILNAIEKLKTNMTDVNERLLNILLNS